jgi:uncharacterized protein with NAD-binding domain and iron-sulfur cluster
MRADATTKLEDIEHSAEEVARTAQDSARIMMDYAVRVQELNMKLAQQAVEAWIHGLRQQSELSQNMIHELFTKTEEQTDALEKFFGPWDNLFMGMPFTFMQQGLRIMEKATTNGGSR